MKFLMGIPSPRDIPQVEQAIEHDLIMIDRLWVRYYPQLEAYFIMRDYFLEHDEYDYLIIAPDDLIVKPQDIRELQRSIRERKRKPVVICGVCNLDKSEPNGFSALSFEIPDLDVTKLTLASYKWIPLSYFDGKSRLIKVKFAGFPLIAIHRSIVKKLRFRGLGMGNCCLDLTFCADCENLNIPIYCNPKIRMVHLKEPNDTVSGIMVGRKQPETILLHANK